MAAKVTVSASTNTSQLIPRLAKNLDPQIKKISVDLGKAMADEANKLIAERFEYRPFDRRRHPGSRRASKAMSYAVLGNQYPFDVVYRILGGPDVEKRIFVLHYGRGPVRISPSGNWPLKLTNKPVLAWPVGSGSSSPSTPKTRAGKSKYKVVYGSVTTGATDKGSGFLQEAEEIAIRKVLRRSR